MKNKKVRGLLQVSRGRVKESVGDATSDQNLVKDGRRDQKQGNLKLAAEKVKDAFRKH